jgi:hypothetical protein
MGYFEHLLRRAARLRQEWHRDLPEVARGIGALFEDAHLEQSVCSALQDPFFPFTLFCKYHLALGNEGCVDVARSARDLALLSRMFLKIRRDINRYFDHANVTCVDLQGGALQKVPPDQWCSFCGECCHLTGTVPDPPSAVRYPGYWYRYIAGDGPLLQKFCPFLFELPPQELFFCSIHQVKPLTCRAYGKSDCQERHPCVEDAGRARERSSRGAILSR